MGSRIGMAGRMALAVVIGLTGAGVMTVVAMDRAGISGREAWLILLAGAGATLAGLAMAGLFGRAGRGGLVWAAFGAVLVTALGGAVAGVLITVTGVAGGAEAIWRAAMTGAAMGPLISISSPVTLALWLAGMGGAHLLARRIRRPE